MDEGFRSGELDGWAPRPLPRPEKEVAKLILPGFWSTGWLFLATIDRRDEAAVFSGSGLTLTMVKTEDPREVGFKGFAAYGSAAVLELRRELSLLAGAGPLILDEPELGMMAVGCKVEHGHLSNLCVCGG